MAMSKKLLDMFNEQIKHEYDSRNVYFGMESYLRDAAYDGFASWFKVQADEEMDHCRYFMEYLVFVGEKFEIRALDAQTNEYESVLDIFEKGLVHEKFITSKIYDLYTQALADKDYHAVKFLDWYVKEQGEEEYNFNDWVDRVRRSKEGPGLMILDQEAATRVHMPSANPPVAL